MNFIQVSVTNEEKRKNSKIFERIIGTWCANSTDRIPSWRSDISQTQDTTLELQVSEKVSETKIFVGVFTRKNLNFPNPRVS